MTDLMETAIAAIKKWPIERQNEAAEILLALDRRGASGATFHASVDDLQAIDEALAQTQRGEFTSDAEIEAAYARFR